MGVYIKNATHQQVMRALMHSTEWLPEDVEIFEVPTPHGDLIDKDDAAKQIVEHTPDLRTMSTKTVGKALSAAKVRIEAEE